MLIVLFLPKPTTRMYENIIAENQDGILVLTINRPAKLNALNQATLTEIKAAITGVYTDSTVKGVIITGAGEKAFVAGADIAEFSGLNAETGRSLAQNGHDIFFLIERCPKPVIAAVNGFALGGGCELAMACHIRIATPNAKFGQPEVNLGLIPGYGGTQRLIQLIGKGRAMELLLTSDMINAQQAHSFGLVNHIAEPADIIGKAKEMLEKIFTKAPLAIGATIASVNAYFDNATNGFNTEVNEFGKLVETADFVEGTTAFIEKRKAEFTGK
jgi:enoyl-CoA hydratase